MVRLLTIAHAASYACQAQPWWGTIDKFEAATSYRQVSIPLNYLRAQSSTSEATRKLIKMPGPGCDKCKDKCKDCKCGDNCSCCDSGKDQCGCKTGGQCTCKTCSC